MVYNKIMMSNEEFESRARCIYGDKYDYSLVTFNGISADVQIICPTHGTFIQSPRNHLLGKGCKYCKKINKRISPEFAVKQMEAKFPNLIFSKFVYKKCEDNSIVICPAHGEFITNYKKMMKFIFFNGCPECKSDYECNGHTRGAWRERCKGRTSFLYLIFIETPFDKCLKSGITSNPTLRFRA